MGVYTSGEKNIDVYPLDITRWKDFETLFGERGACGGCWCMSWRHCKMNGVKIIEAYPVLPYSSEVPDAFMWTGMPTAFEREGFVVAERRSNSKPIMRYYI